MLFPDVTRRGEIKFRLLKGMPYGVRMFLVLALLVIGFPLQILNIYVGAGFLLAASILMIVKGYDSRPAGLTSKKEWRDASSKQLLEIAEMARRAKKWDQSVIDITCRWGFLLLLIVVVAIGSLAIYLLGQGYIWLASTLVVDSIALLVPHWITGVRRILTRAPLTIKVHEIIYVYALWKKMKVDDEVMLPQIEVFLGEKGDMPNDAKLIIKIPSLSDDFLGLQVQVVLNNVQGVDYPYLYCVLVARPEFGLLDKLSSVPVGNILVEEKKQRDADVIVIRQHTTATSGYHTKRPAVRSLFMFALAEARKLKAASSS